MVTYSVIHSSGILRIGIGLEAQPWGSNHDFYRIAGPLLKGGVFSLTIGKRLCLLASSRAEERIENEQPNPGG